MNNTDKASKFIGHLVNKGLLNLDINQTKQTISVLAALLTHAESTAINDYVTLERLTKGLTEEVLEQGE